MTPQKTTGENAPAPSRLARIMADIGKRKLGGRVYAMRRAKNLTIHQLAARAKIHVRCVISAEDGVGVTEANLRKLLTALGAKEKDLLDVV